MFSNFLAQHQPYMRDYGPATAAPAPSITPSPAPPEDDAIAFSAAEKPCLWGTVGSAMGSTTLATITCADASMTAERSLSIAGLTFAYAANVLSVSGTPTGPSGVFRLVVSYISSDGNRTVRGSTEHEITIWDTSEELTIGDMESAAGKVGRPLTATLASPAANFPVDVVALPQTMVPGLTVALDWTVGVSDADGDLTISGTPTEAGTFTLTVNYSGRGTELGTSTHTIIVAEAFEAIPSAPAAAPGPAAPAPAPAPACTPAPAPPVGPDAGLEFTQVLMRFDAQGLDTAAEEAVALALDRRGNTFSVLTMSGGALASTTGAVSGGALFSDGGRISGTAAALVNTAGEYESTTVECMVDVSSTSTLWSAPATSLRYYMPIVTTMSPAGAAGGAVIWTFGLISIGTGPIPGEYTTRQVFPCFMVRTENTTLVRGDVTYRWYTQAAFGFPINTRPGRFIHLAGMLKNGSPCKVAAWGDGMAPYSGTCATFTGRLRRDLSTIHIGTIPGGALHSFLDIIDPNGDPFVISGLLPPRMALDELRIKTTDHYGSLITGSNTQADIPAASRVIPWPNY